MSSYPRSAANRLLRDIRTVYTNTTLKDSGIYYKHDDNVMTVGYGLIIGPSDTVYSDGNYMFKFEFPPTYPHAPPTVTFLCQNNSIRIHPNLYRTGKVCLSIINTWGRNQWTSCQSINSILLSLHSILTNNPLEHEPDYHNKQQSMCYEKIVYFANINIYICDTIITHDAICPYFTDIIINHFVSNYHKIVERLDAYLIDQPEMCELSVPMYNMNFIVLHYPRLKRELALAHSFALNRI